MNGLKPIRLIAVDLDGTMLGGTPGRYGILPEGIAALKNAAAKEVMIAVVSGRDFPFIPQMLREEGIDIALYGWPQVIVAEERCEYWLDPDTGTYQPDAEWNETIQREEVKHFERLTAEVDAMLAGELSRLDPDAYRRTDDMAVERGYVEVRFSNASSARSAEPLLAEMLKKLDVPFMTVRNVEHICLRHVSTGKGRMLERVCRRLGIAAEEVLAIGDSLNDLTMLDGRSGFIGAAPGNADEDVKAAVRARGGTVAEAHYAKGVAEIIDRYI